MGFFFSKFALNLHSIDSYFISLKFALWKSKLLRGDYSVNIQSRIMVLVHGTSSHWHLSINKVSFNPFSTFKDMARTDIQYEKVNCYGEITQ